MTNYRSIKQKPPGDPIYQMENIKRPQKKITKWKLDTNKTQRDGNVKGTISHYQRETTKWKPSRHNHGETTKWKPLSQYQREATKWKESRHYQGEITKWKSSRHN